MIGHQSKGTVYDAKGNELFSFAGISGIYPDLAIGPSGRVYVTDGSNIAVFESDGTFVQDIGTFASAQSVAVDSNENVYVYDGTDHDMTAMDSSGNVLATWGQEGTAPGEFWARGAVAVSKTDEIYVCDTDRIQVFNTTGGFIRSFGLQLSGLKYIHSMDVAPEHCRPV